MAVRLDVGGVKFKSTVHTLTSVPDSYLGRMFSGDWSNQKDEQGCVFIDRNGLLFSNILDFLRNGPNTDVPTARKSRAKLRVEAEFYCLDGLLDLIDKCNKDDDKLISLRFQTTLQEHFTQYKELRISLAQLRSSPGSYFWHLANNISRGDVSDDPYATERCGRYYIRVGRSKDDLRMGMLVCEFLKFGPDAVPSLSSQEESEFHQMAKNLDVTEAVHWAVEEFYRERCESPPRKQKKH